MSQSPRGRQVRVTRDFAHGGSLVGHELQSLVTRQCGEAFAGAHGRGCRIPLAPVNRLINGACDGQHRRRNVHADNSCVWSEPFTGKTRHNAGATDDVDHAVAPSQRDARNELLRERPEQPTRTRS